jgi:CRP-like cAMP-binding protein
MKSMPVQGPAVERVASAVRGSPLFRSLSDDQLRQAVARTALVLLEPGETLVRAGEPPEGFFVVLDGELRVLMGVAAGQEEIEVARFGAGQMVGVASLLLDRPNDATLCAGAVSTVVRFSTSFFQTMAEQVPTFGLAVARALAERWRSRSSESGPEADPSCGRPTRH